LILESPGDGAFRAEAKEFLSAFAPPRREGDDLDTTMFVVDREAELDMVARGREWQRVKFDHGWAGIHWPEAYGGRGGTVSQDLIFREEEQVFASVWLTHNLGLAIAGPPILLHGTEDQKGRFIPPMLRGDAVWCQLFSEPSAGSDLGAVRTAAVRDGDEWVVNGQKVWSSKAHFSDWGLLVTRTDFEADKYRGITCFALDMRSPGVEVRPIRQINGASHFNEVFLTDVRVPHGNLIGEADRGWSVALSTLQGERTAIGGVGGGPAIDELLALARGGDAGSDRVLRERVAAVYSRTRVFPFLRELARNGDGGYLKPGLEGSVLKLFLSRHVAGASELAVDLLGAAGMLAGDDAPDRGRWPTELAGHFSYRIGGGTDEIQRNLIGERVLGLPPDQRVDKGVPFRRIPS
jgi:alkylation response protein AidB-like acyl-CoA dehydrogenase